MKKPSRIAISCTTMEALNTCIVENCSVLSIEEPLYTRIKDTLEFINGISAYEITEYSSEHFFILIKARGPQSLDKGKYEVYYYPLHGPK